MQRDQNGNFPPVTTNQICVCCKKPLHPICGLVHERTSFLTCLLCHEQFGRAFESPESATAYTSAKETTEQVPGGGQDEMDSISVGEEVGEGEGVGVSLARARMVQELKKQMTPANCRKENRAISTRMKNESEACRIVVWLYGLKNDEDYETKKRLKALIDERLLLQIGLQIDGIVGEKKESKKIKAVRAATKAWLDVEENPAPPFAFSGFTYDDYANYLRVQLKKDGDPLKGKCYKNKRSNLNNLFKKYKHQPTPEFQDKVTEYMDGVVRLVAAAAQNGVGTIESGKRELSFQAYEKLQQWLLEERSHEGVFARAFLSLTWNLMCRGVNTCVCLKHFAWKDDCFGLSFSHVKNDQDGSRNFHPRHIYANPDNYLLCCVTAVFEYLLCFPGLFKDEHTMLFPGPSQEERFSEILERVLNKHKEELLTLGYVPSDIGVHSIRKGACTYASSGTTAAPSSTSVNNRGGWTLGGARDVYMLYERAGDQYVGRILSGMNVLSATFGASCPDFIYHADVLSDGQSAENVTERERQQGLLESKVSSALMACFGNLDKFAAIRRTLRFGLASVLHHLEQGKHYHAITTATANHTDDAELSTATTNSPQVLSPVCLSPVYRSKHIFELKSRVRVVYPWEADDVAKRCVMRLTGIPPHVIHLAQMKQMQELLASMPPLILGGIEKMLDDRTVNGTMSETRMRALIEEGQQLLMDELRRATAASNLLLQQQECATNDQQSGNMMNIVEDGNIRHKLWMHKGKFRRVPPMWTFPSCNVHTAYKLWHTQNTVTGQSAMIFLRPVDVDCQKDGGRRLEEFRYLMWRFDAAAKELGLLRPRMTELDCSTAINAVVDTLGVPLETPKGRQRHLEKLKWPMYLMLLPNKRRPTKEEFKAPYRQQQQQREV